MVGMEGNGPFYMGFDLSTQQLKGIVVDSRLKLHFEAKVDFDADLSRYGIEKGVLTNAAEGEVFAPPVMWLDAINLVLDRLEKAGLDFGQVKGFSGAGMQHGTVFWSEEAENLLLNLDPSKSLADQLGSGPQESGKGAFAHPMSPNWQDASTQEQCDAFDAALGSPETLADVTGSKAHHRFSGPQILRYRTKYPRHYEETARISLVSSFLASVFRGQVAPIDIGDVGGMNLWDLHKNAWDDRLLALAAGGEDKVAELKKKLGDVAEDGGAAIGTISNYFITRYGFPEDCKILPSTGDNPATILALPLRPSDAIVSLGTSTTFLMSTPHYKPDPAYHFMAHPCTPGLYMFMLCYKNGGLAREQIRDELHAHTSSSSPSTTAAESWEPFNATTLSTPPLSQTSPHDPMQLGLYFPRPEIVPNLPPGRWRFSYDPSSSSSPPETRLRRLRDTFHPSDARTIVESQMLSLRLRAQNLVTAPPSPPSPPADGRGGDEGGDGDGTHLLLLPPQPRRVYLVGGGSANPALARVCGQVLGGVEGVYRLDIGGNACALGAAYKAVWGCERDVQAGETFEELIGKRWDEGAFVKKIADGYEKGVFERYGEAVEGFEMMERKVVREEGELKGQRGGGVVVEADS